MNHHDLEALIRAAERYFRLEKDQLRATGGRYTPLIQMRQVTQLVARERGFTGYAIAKAFGYKHIDGTSIRRNLVVARNHLHRGHAWWYYTKAALVDAWAEELDAFIEDLGQ